MDDLISRQDAIKAIEEKAKRIKNEDTLNGLGGAIAILFDLPSVKPQPCEDAISRRAVDEAIYDYSRSCDVNYAQIMEYIDKLPSVKPQEPTGHWIAIDEEPHEDYECDKCGYTISTYTANIEPHTEYKYCPNCGARMVKPQERREE